MKKNYKILPLFAIIPGWATACPLLVSCQQPIQQDLFDISRGVLYGFNKNLSSSEIASRIGNTLEIPENVTWISHYAFYNATNDESTIPSKVTKLSFKSNKINKIGDYAFKKAPFDRLQISCLISIGQESFSNCPNLKTLTFLESNSGACGNDQPNPGLFIGKKAFYACDSLERINFNKIMYSSFIDFAAFGACPKLNMLDFSKVAAKPVWSNENNIFQESGSEVARQGRKINILLSTNFYLDELRGYFLKMFQPNIRSNDLLITTEFDVFKFNEEDKTQIDKLINFEKWQWVGSDGLNKQTAHAKFPSYVQGFGPGAFLGEDGVTSLIVERDSSGVGYSDLAKNNNLLYFYEKCFYNNPFKTIIIPRDIEFIGENAFSYSNESYCKLTDITFSPIYHEKPDEVPWKGRLFANAKKTGIVLKYDSECSWMEDDQGELTEEAKQWLKDYILPEGAEINKDMSKGWDVEHFVRD